MTANIDNLRDGKSVGRIREKGFIGGYKLVTTGKANIERVDVRFYAAPRGSVVYCIVWISGNNKWGRGVGQADGYGYDKRSAALGAALDDAGIMLSEDISGRGDCAEGEAIRAIGDALGCPDAVLVDFYA